MTIERLFEKVRARKLPAIPVPQLQTFRVRWSIGTYNRGKDRGPVFDPAKLVPRPLVDAAGKPVMTRHFNVDTKEWEETQVIEAEAEPLNAAEEKAQQKARERLAKQLQRDGFTLSHTDADGFVVYVKPPAPDVVRPAAAPRAAAGPRPAAAAVVVRPRAVGERPSDNPDWRHIAAVRAAAKRRENAAARAGTA